MTIETVDLLQVRPGVDEDERGDHSGVSGLGCRVGGALTSANHHGMSVPAHTGNILTSLDYPDLNIDTGIKFGVSSSLSQKLTRFIPFHLVLVVTQSVTQSVYMFYVEINYPFLFWK